MPPFLSRHALIKPGIILLMIRGLTISFRYPFVSHAAAYLAASRSIDMVMAAIDASGPPAPLVTTAPPCETSQPIITVGAGMKGLLVGVAPPRRVFWPPNLALTFMQTLEMYWPWAFLTWLTFNIWLTIPKRHSKLFL